MHPESEVPCTPQALSLPSKSPWPLTACPSPAWPGTKWAICLILGFRWQGHLSLILLCLSTCPLSGIKVKILVFVFFFVLFFYLFRAWVVKRHNIYWGALCNPNRWFDHYSHLTEEETETLRGPRTGLQSWHCRDRISGPLTLQTVLSPFEVFFEFSFHYRDCKL